MTADEAAFGAEAVSGLRLNHTGLVVADLERSITFYKLFGAQVIGEVPLAGVDADRGMGVEGIRGQCVLLRIGSQVVELLAFDEPAPTSFAGSNATVGVAHLAFEVDDIATVVEALAAAGVAFKSAPIPITEGEFAGGSWCYCSDPDGVPVELIQPGPGFRRMLDAIRGLDDARL